MLEKQPQDQWVVKASRYSKSAAVVIPRGGPADYDYIFFWAWASVSEFNRLHSWSSQYNFTTAGKLVKKVWVFSGTVSQRDALKVPWPRLNTLVEPNWRIIGFGDPRPSTTEIHENVNICVVGKSKFEFTNVFRKLIYVRRFCVFPCFRSSLKN